MRTSTSAFAVCKVVASIIHDFFSSRRPFNFEESVCAPFNMFFFMSLRLLSMFEELLLRLAQLNAEFTQSVMLSGVSVNNATSVQLGAIWNSRASVALVQRFFDITSSRCNRPIWFKFSFFNHSSKFSSVRNNRTSRWRP